MRKVFMVLAYVFTVLSILFSILPLDTLAFVAIVPALLCISLAFWKSSPLERKWPKRLFIVTYICALGVLGKTFLIEETVEKDAAFEQQKVEAKQEAQQELEDLEKELE
ncbi:hypothetical protein [Flavobacterium sp.]|jgi:hypothetical protein|uniref:hypothetical protein n=1 Tax=Flavobacterium sp. TaxID=239 RepID=UPI002623CD78|nr:hypothetical protein [Flavobacterium sp.]